MIAQSIFFGEVFEKEVAFINTLMLSCYFQVFLIKAIYPKKSWVIYKNLILIIITQLVD